MQHNKQHITFRVIALLLVFAVTLPSVVKLAHLFENHEHTVCYGEQNTHAHAIDLDCEFYKFKINTNVYLITNNFDLINTTYYFKSKIYNYNFLSNHQQLSTYLRGPPLS